MPNMRKGGAGIVAVAMAAALPAASFQAYASDLLIDTETLRSHAASGPPPVILLPDMLLAPPVFQFRHGNLEKTKGVADTVAGARKPFKAAVGYDGTANARIAAVQGAHRGAGGFVMGGYRRDEAKSYGNKDGRKFTYGYDRDAAQLVLGWTPNAETSLRAIGIGDEIRDERQPHFNTDVLKNDRKVGRVILDRRNVFGDAGDLEVSFRIADLDRRADNYSLRSQSGTRIRVALDRTAYDGQVKAGFKTGVFSNTLAIGLAHDNHGARRYNMTGGNLVNAERLPDIDRNRVSVNLESEVGLGEGGAGLLKGGIRYDLVHTAPNKAHITPGGGPNAFFNVSPANLYKTYYGSDDIQATDHNLSGRLRYEHKVASGLTLHGDLSRMVRSGDSLEKYHALSGPVASRWVGNPGIKPEKHHKAELGFVHQGEGFIGYQRKQPGGELLDSLKIGGSVFYDHVDDFISLDKARGQKGVLTSDNALVYRNVDARFIGIEADLQWNLSRNWATRINLVQTWATNTTDDRPVYQVAPLEGNLLLDYQNSLFHVGTWNAGLRLRMVADKTRIDADATAGSGFDERTGGFATMDIHGGIQLYDRIALTGGIDNIFNKGYREFIKGTHVEASPDKTTIDAPGRTAYVRLIANF